MAGYPFQGMHGLGSAYGDGTSTAGVGGGGMSLPGAGQNPWNFLQPGSLPQYPASMQHAQLAGLHPAASAPQHPGKLGSSGMNPGSGMIPGLVPTGDASGGNQPWAHMQVAGSFPAAASSFLTVGGGRPAMSAAAAMQPAPQLAFGQHPAVGQYGMSGAGFSNMYHMPQQQQLQHVQQQVPLHSLHSGGIPPGFMPQQAFGTPAFQTVPTVAPAAKVQEQSPAAPSRRFTSERREAARAAVRLSIPEGGVTNNTPEGSRAVGGRRHNADIKAEECAGQVVWAKLARYPWWPAQVLLEDDPYIPAGSEPPRRGAVPVRFFGTYEFSWIESQRMLVPFAEGFAEHSQQPDEDGFGASVEEAQQFLATGVLPEGFELALLENDEQAQAAMPPPPPPPPPKAKASAERKRKSTPAAATTKSNKSRAKAPAAAKAPVSPPDPAAVAEAVTEAIAERQFAVRRSLCLAAPQDSPFARTASLDGLRQVMAKAAGSAGTITGAGGSE